MKSPRLLTLFAAFVAIITGASTAFAEAGGTPQASLSLQNCDTKLCYQNNTSWSLTKEVTGNTVTNGVGTITWTVTATKGTVSGNVIEVHGYLDIHNGGGANATIGNIVINLQKR